MELRDLIVTPLLIMIVYVVAYIVRPWTTDDINRRYFFPALTARLVGALALGFIYQFYYHGGDTYNFHTHGSRHIWEAFMDTPSKGLKLLFPEGDDDMRGIYEYASKIPFYRDKSSYTIVQIAALFDLLTFSTYSATAVCFAVVSFIGSWMLFLTFYRSRPHLSRPIAMATLFIPSVLFWGSGLLKDTITLACLGVLTYSISQVLINRKIKISNLLLMTACFIMIYSIKKYILLCYVPAVLLWIYASYMQLVKSRVFRIMLIPFLLLLIALSGYFAVRQIGKDDARYDLNRIGFTARETAYDIAYFTGRDAGSVYTLGELDGSFQNLVTLAPEAINVSLFRPYIWEVNNPLMLMSSVESLAILLLTTFVAFKCWKVLPKVFLNYDVIFCAVFSLTFAFAVGVSTFNFGTLSRYKIPLLPFYLLALIFIYDYWKRERNFSELDRTEY